MADDTRRDMESAEIPIFSNPSHGVTRTDHSGDLSVSFILGFGVKGDRKKRTEEYLSSSGLSHLKRSKELFGGRRLNTPSMVRKKAKIEAKAT